MTQKERIANEIFEAVLADLWNGKEIPVSTHARTVWLTSAFSIRLQGLEVQMYENKTVGWVTLGRGTLDHWAKVKGLVSLTDLETGGDEINFWMVRIRFIQGIL